MKIDETVTSDNYNELLKIKYNGKFIWKEEYKEKSKDKILIHCNDCGSEWKVSPYDMIKRGRTCKVCTSNQRVIDGFNKLKSNLIDLYGYIPYIFLSDYEKVDKHMKVRCKECNDEFKITPINMLNITGKNINEITPPCSKCNNERKKKNMIMDINYYMDKIKKEFNIEYTIINPDEYTGATNELKFKCGKCDHIFTSTQYNLYYSLVKSNGKVHVCPSCNKLVRDERSYEEKLNEINPNIINIEPYITRETKIKHKCLECDYVWETSPNSRYHNSGCPNCNNIITTSKMENELYEILKEIYDGEIDRHSRYLLGNGQEIDIYIPEFKLGIEMDGLYWHNSEKKDKKYHLNKTLLANEKGIHLIHIFEDEWINKKDIVIDKIKSKLNLNNSNRIYARNCTIDVIDTNTKNDFLTVNHIQGKDISPIRLGLFYNGELVSVMTFGKPRISTGNNDVKDNEYELIRYASLLNTSVVGGFSKLLKYFTRNYDYNRIITYADLRYSKINDNVYNTIGFNKINTSLPNYWYFDRNNVSKKYHRYTFRKNVLDDKLSNFNKDLTEYENMKNNNYLRIYDCGNLVYEMINKEL